jgi:hypothetical protein
MLLRYCNLETGNFNGGVFSTSFSKHNLTLMTFGSLLLKFWPGQLPQAKTHSCLCVLVVILDKNLLTGIAGQLNLRRLALRPTYKHISLGMAPLVTGSTVMYWY